MSTSILLILLSPFLLLTTVVGVVLTVALHRARPEDLPDMLRESARMLRRMADRMPKSPRGAPDAEHTGLDDEEVR